MHVSHLLNSVSQSAPQVLKTLEQRGTSTKPREDLQAFAVALKAEFKKLTSEDLVQLINHAPSSIFEAYLCLENAITADRITEDDLDRIVEIVAQHLIN